MNSMSKSTKILIVLALVFLCMAFASAKLSVSRTIKAIDEIGTLKLGDGSMERFEKAADCYQSLDGTLKLPDKVTNAKTYEEDKYNYCRIKIKEAVLADIKKDKAADAVKDARAAVDKYVATDEVWNIENYQALLDLEAEYSGGGAPQEDAGEAPPMC